MNSRSEPVPASSVASAARGGRRAAAKRIAIKWLIFAIVLLLVQFPNPAYLVRHVRHWSNPEALIQPDSPEIAGLERLFRAQLNAGPASAPMLAVSAPASAEAAGAAPGTLADDRLIAAEVERFVLDTVQYEWDWNLWGASDYLPTIAEIFAKARATPGGRLREDCDGRALLAAALLRRLGHPAELVTDFGHVWVRTRADGKPLDLMGPGRSASVVASTTGVRVTVGWQALRNISVAAAYGLAVFPWLREFVVYVTLMALLAHPRMSRRAAATGAALAFAGWHLMRAPIDYYAPALGHFWLGVVYVLAGCGVQMLAARRARVAPSIDRGA